MNYKNWVVRSIGVTSLFLGTAWAQVSVPQPRVQGTVTNQEKVVVKDTVPALLAKSREIGRMSPSEKLNKMILLLAPSAEQEQGAQDLVASLHDPSSPSYHKWLTPAQFGQGFGLGDPDTAQVQQWLQSEGFTISEVSQSRRFIVFGGNVSQVERAFSTQMHTYTYNGKQFISNSSEIQIPAALAPVVAGVVRLHSDPHTPAAVSGGKVHFTKKGGSFQFSDGSNNMTPADFAKIYNVQPLYDAGIDGSGQTIAIVGRSNIDVQNIRDFRSVLGLPANDPEVIVNGDDPGETYYDMPEALLDVTWSGAVAPKAKIKFVVSQSNFSDGIDASAAYIVDHNLAPVMSTSYGSCEAILGKVLNAFYNSLWQQAAAQGITSFVSVGDNGGAGCDAPGGGVYSGGFGVNGIASTPYNIAVGGTQFDDTSNPGAYWTSTNDPVTGRSALGYIPEKVWNESLADPNWVSLWAGSGGASSVYTKPDWQTAFGVPNDGRRDVPDFSLSAAVHDGYLVCMYSSCSYGDYFYTFGGTSASSPAAAAIMALVNQKMDGQRQGVANYVFYKLASTPGVYHDTVKGDNKVPDAAGQTTVGYSAGPGYDLASGLGSMDVSLLVNSWHDAAKTLGTATSLALANGQNKAVIHGMALTFDAAVTCSSSSKSCAAPTGSVALMSTSSKGDVLEVGTGTLHSHSSNGTAKIATGTVPGGSYDVAARYSGDGTYYSSTSKPVRVTVTPESSYSYLGAIGGGSFVTAPLSISYGEGLPIGVVVAGGSGYGYPSGVVTLQADGKPVGTRTLNYGEKSTLTAPGIKPVSQSSSISVLPAGLAAGPHQLTSIYPGDSSFGSSQASYGFTVTKADSAIVDFFLVGSIVRGVPIKLAGQTAFLNYGFAPYGGTITVTDVTGPAPVVLGVGNVDSTLYGGSYEITVTFATAGKHIVRLNYSGDSNVNPSSGTYNLDIPVNVPSSTSLTADVQAVNAGSPITFTASVAADLRAHSPTGTVTFVDGTATIGNVAVDATGNAVLVNKTLTGGLHTITANYSGDSVITSSVSAAITELVSDYKVEVTPSTLNIKAGTSGMATFNLTPVSGSKQTVQLSCGSLPASITCDFSQQSVTLDGANPTMVTLTVHTDGGLARVVPKGSLWPVTAPFALAAVLFPFNRRRLLKWTLALCGLFVLILYGVGCGGSTASPTTVMPAGSYSITVTASTGTPTTGRPIPLTVNITK